jgi:hypothetical protein
MNEKQLYEFWKKYVNTKIYHVTSEKYISVIKKNGLNPKKNPLGNKYPEIIQLFKLIKRFEDKGIIYTEEWRDGIKKGSEIIEISKESINNNYIDFVSDYNQALKFKKKWRGGALANIVFNYANFLKNKRLSKSERELVRMLNLWAEKERKYKNKIIYVKGSGKFLEGAKLLLLPLKGKKKIVTSPYGSYEYFINVIRNKLNLYERYLKQEELSYLRVMDKIPKEDIFILQ